MVNISTGKSAKKETEAYLLGTLERGSELRHKFESECTNDNSRFLRSIPRTSVTNFAAENVKPKSTGSKNAAEDVRDVFARIIALERQMGSSVDLKHILSYPVTELPLALAHSDGTPNNTDKSVLTKALEREQDQVINVINAPPVDALVIDGGLLLHETLVRHRTSTYACMARDLLVKACSLRGQELHIVFDKYEHPSIKDPERRHLSAVFPSSFTISGPEQIQCQSGALLLRNSSFKEEFVLFAMKEWEKKQYKPILEKRVMYVSHGGHCVRFTSATDADGQILTDEPEHLQARHEEADTLIAFHARRVEDAPNHIMIRSTDTDVLVILIALVGRHNELKLDYGSGNHRRYIDVSAIAHRLENKKSGLSEALVGFHALTGSDFTSAFHRIGKVRPLQRLINKETDQHLSALRSLTSAVDVAAVTSYVCALYGHNIDDIDEARFKTFLRISGGKTDEPLANLKKMNCAILPPCSKTLLKHIERSNFVARMWRRADDVNPTEGQHPLHFGCVTSDSGFQPVVLWERCSVYIRPISNKHCC